MKNKTTITRIFILMIIVMGFFAMNQVLEQHCPQRPEQLHINSTINIQSLYPWPGAEIPFPCHIRDFLKSPFAPRLINYYEVVYKEDGLRIIEGNSRRGVVKVNIFATGEFLPVFDESMAGKMPLLAESLSFYIDGKKLRIGHIGWRELDVEFNFATILNPFLLPGEHTGKIVLLLPSGETREYEWQFEITWW
jgi:hypothetical protein